MSWHKRHGKKLAFYKERALNGFRTPLESQPKDDPFSIWFINAFADLAKFRDEAGKISLTDIVTYWEKVGSIGTLKEFINIISRLNKV